MSVEAISKLVENILSDYPDLFLVDVTLKGNPNNQKLIVLVDGDPNVNIDDCAEISRKLGLQIEEGEIISGKYILEVSSPGIDTPLKLPRQYTKNVGREVKMELESGGQLKGKLHKVEGDQIVVLEKKSGKEVDLKIQEIKKTNILVSFS